MKGGVRIILALFIAVARSEIHSSDSSAGSTQDKEKVVCAGRKCDRIETDVGLNILQANTVRKKGTDQEDSRTGCASSSDCWPGWFCALKRMDYHDRRYVCVCGEYFESSCPSGSTCVKEPSGYSCFAAPPQAENPDKKDDGAKEDEILNLQEEELYERAALEHIKGTASQQQALEQVEEQRATSAVQRKLETAEEVEEMSELNGKLSKLEKAAANEAAFASVTKAYLLLLKNDYCLKDTWDRGERFKVCKSGWYQGGSIVDGGLCYKHCPSSYSRFGEHCVENCPHNMNTVGIGIAAYCQREYWDPWPKIETKSLAHERSPGCTLNRDECAGCPSGYRTEGGEICYETPKPNYYCSPGALACTNTCPGRLGHECGAGCALDGGSCAEKTFEMVTGVLEAAIQTSILVLTFGSSASATAMGSATRAAMTNAAKKQARRNAVLIQKQAFKQALKEERKRLVKKAVADTVKGKITEKKEQLMYQYALQGSEGMAEAFEEKMKKEGDDPALIAVKEVDPTGLAAAIHSSVEGEDTANQQASNWMKVMSTVDPTGIIGAVANFVQHSHCDDMYAKEEEEKNKEIVVPSKDALTEAPWTPIARDAYCNQGATSRSMGQTPSGEHASKAACEEWCDGDATCNFYLYRHDPNSNPNSKYFCQKFSSCDSTHAFGDGDGGSIYKKPR